MRRLTRAAAPLIVIATLLAGCVSTNSSAVIEQLQGRHDAAARTKPFDSLVDLLPNRTYQAGDGPQWRYSSSVVVGHFTAVEAGRAYSAKDSPSGVEVPFDSPDAAWRTFHATVKVDRVVAGRALKEGEQVGFSFGPDLSPDEVLNGLESLGTVLLFLDESSQVFSYAPEVLGTAWDGELVAQVDSEGNLTFPALQGDNEAPPFRVTSIDGLEAAARSPGERITLDPTGAEVLSRKPV
ncbi:hypothetical protein [Nostocoides sp. Soil756]|jgi:hypothetical protein|uniref:hypothetical protein n=1 Tax=Nostocoides sp. Soil756 TaxID=1736399 RepID=UPI0006F3D32C|nr:hypothetical protein [Tetrasphaera sp. Soil756]KRE60146.1 hypothetical protein ASG78_15720 [Tetrasphaera sp. Soil756]